MNASSWSLYSLLAGLIATWWFFAFINSSFSIPSNSHPARSFSLPNWTDQLSDVKREEIQEGLSGNISLMIKLIAQWEKDAYLLKSYGLTDVKRLSQQDYLTSQLIGRCLLQFSEKELTQTRLNHCLEYVQDDTKTFFACKKFQRFLPQTYVAASFLLALAPTSQIVAIPRGLKTQTHLYPSALTSTIPLDIDRFHAEKIFLAKPDIAFIASYSHPHTLYCLRQQGVKLFALKDFHSLEDIQESLLKVGHLCNFSLEAELLKIFTEAALNMIDNRFKLFKASFSNSLKVNFLFLHYSNHLSTPYPNSLTGQLLTRTGLHTEISSLKNFEGPKIGSYPLDLEKIMQLNPTFLIFSVEHRDDQQAGFTSHVCRQFPALKAFPIFTVDSTVQDSPTQYIILAYYDLYQALKGYFL